MYAYTYSLLNVTKFWFAYLHVNILVAPHVDVHVQMLNVSILIL